MSAIKRRSSLSKPKLAPVGEIPSKTRTRRQQGSSLLYKLGVKLFVFGYGFLNLLGFIYACYIQDRRYRAMSSKDKQDLEAGKLIWY
jgi:hypothetical protein